MANAWQHRAKCLRRPHSSRPRCAPETSSAVETARAAIDRAERHRATFGGVAALAPERSLAAARESDARLAAGTARALEGVPITVKDWIDVAGWPVGGHPVDPDRRPDRDATAVARLRAEGAVVVAISAAHADNTVHGATRNPHDATRAPGGSSSGAAALVAAGVTSLALGSDSGGSIRLPAAWCGVPGLKPSFGRVPLTGHIPRAAALSDGRTVIGPIAATVDDLALTLGIIAGPDGLDAGVAPVPLLDDGTVDARTRRGSSARRHKRARGGGLVGIVGRGRDRRRRRSARHQNRSARTHPSLLGRARN